MGKTGSLAMNNSLPPAVSLVLSVFNRSDKSSLTSSHWPFDTGRNAISIKVFRVDAFYLPIEFHRFCIDWLLFNSICGGHATQITKSNPSISRSLLFSLIFHTSPTMHINFQLFSDGLIQLALLPQRKSINFSHKMLPLRCYRFVAHKCCFIRNELPGNRSKNVILTIRCTLLKSSRSKSLSMTDYISR